MINRTFAVFVLSTAAGLIGLAPETAEAKWSRQSAFGCTTSDSYSGWGNTLTNSTNSNIRVSCDLDDTDHYQKQEISVINAHIYQSPGNTSTYAKACVTSWDVVGGSCGNWVATPAYGSGNFTLSPQLDAFDIGGAKGDFGYLQLQLPSGTRFKGFYTAT